MHLVDITMFYAAEGGGVSTYINAKARWLAQRARVRHTIFSSSVRGDSDLPSLVRFPGLAVPGLHGYRFPLSVARPARLMAQLQPDLIEVGDAGPAAWAALRVKRQLGIPVVAFYHSDLARLIQARFGRMAMLGACRYLAQLYGQCDLVLAPSRLMAQRLASMGVPGAVHQPLGIDSGVFSPQHRIASLREQLAVPSASRLLVYAGRFTPEKKLALLIEAVRLLGQPYYLVLIGGGMPLPPSAQTRVIPFQRNQLALARLLASCDALVHPGDCETFGLIVLEAMACGLPVVGTSGGSVAELVDERSGVLVPPNCAASLAAGIDALFARDIRALSAAAASAVREHYDWDRILPQLMARYAGLLATHQRAELKAEPGCVPE
ncbi:glycosyltransferase [Massilia sp. CF038]|uniref:glycosyltransferase n=1 Tax=Massilia sp. CF038 TaxID=1881045 RepID=UPI0009246487|nr:glycosyltransferase [Massilia sp. CF038]SHH11117.1 alpha-1,6-mannosyltransferase [Massilia sp. CF038]